MKGIRDLLRLVGITERKLSNCSRFKKEVKRLKINSTIKNEEVVEAFNGDGTMELDGIICRSGVKL